MTVSRRDILRVLALVAGGTSIVPDVVDGAVGRGRPVSSVQTVIETELPTLDWIRTYGGPGDDAATDVLETADGYLFVGRTEAASGDDAWFVEVDGDGNVRWQRTFGGLAGGVTDDVANEVIETSDGGYLAVGTSESATTDGSRAMLWKVDAAGTLEWMGPVGGSLGDVSRGNSVVEAADGGYVLGGFTSAVAGGALLVKVDAHGVEQWREVYDFGGTKEVVTVLQRGLRGYAFLASPVGRGSGLVGIVEVDGDGDVLSNVEYGAEAFSRPSAQSMIGTEEGYFFVGTFTDESEEPQAWHVEVDSDGRVLFDTLGGVATADTAVELSDGFLVGGTSESFDLPSGGYLERMDENGERLGFRLYGDTDLQIEGVLVGNDGGLVVVGIERGPDSDDSDAFFGRLGTDTSPLSLAVSCTASGPRGRVTNVGDRMVEVRDIDSRGQDVIDGRPELAAGRDPRFAPGESLALRRLRDGRIVLRAYDPASGRPIGSTIELTVDCEDELPDQPLDVSVVCTPSGATVTVTNAGGDTVEVRDIDSSGQDVIDGRPTLAPGESLTLTGVGDGAVVVRAYDPTTGDPVAPAVGVSPNCRDD